LADASASETGQREVLMGQPGWIQRILGTPGILLSFAWGFAEGTFFFVVPDVALSLVALVQPRRAWRHVLAALLGGMIAGALLFGRAQRNPGGARSAIARVPLVSAAMLAQVQASYRTHGIGAVFLGPWSGIPYKVYAVEAPPFLGAAEFVMSAATARALRFLLLWAVFGIVGQWLLQRRGWTIVKIVKAHGAFWVLFYAFYWGMIATR
jgi:membrane protein YqaA with SNARE-associated domain